MVDDAYVFDTNILIDYTKGFPEAKILVDRCRRRMISIVTWIEMMVGANPETEPALRVLLDQFVLLPITPLIAERTIVARRKLRLKLPDAIILATAESEDCRLLTRNTRDFSPDDARVLVPYRLQ